MLSRKDIEILVAIVLGSLALFLILGLNFYATEVSELECSYYEC